ncbi:MAG: folate family ECF transporter S component, partial [Pygmaiobacter sp.]
MNKNNFNAKCIAQMALLIALEIILSRFVSIPTPIVKISFSFLAIVTMAMLYGPVYAAAGAALADFLGAILIPFGAPPPARPGPAARPGAG